MVRNIDRFCQFGHIYMHPTALKVKTLLFFIGTSIYPTAPFGCLMKCKADSSRCFGYPIPNPQP